MAFIKIENINFYYNPNTPQETHALKDINLEINKGEYLVFFGPSGCGKTTLTYLVGGIETERSGTGNIIVDDKDVLKLSKDELAAFRQTGIGIIFQQFNLSP
jgi:putative ABC transport system ATP-binding protein